MNSSDEAEVPVQIQKAKDICFEKNKHGKFILPQCKILKQLSRNRGSFGDI